MSLKLKSKYPAVNVKMLTKRFMRDIEYINKLTFTSSPNLLVTSLAYIDCAISCNCSIRCFVNGEIQITTRQKKGGNNHSNYVY